MNIVKTNSLLESLKDKLASLDPEVQDEGIETMKQDDPKSVPTANAKMSQLLAKLTAGRSKANAVRATGTK